MTTRTSRLLCAGLAGLAVLGLAGTPLRGYVLNGHKWGTSTVTYYVNPQSQWVSSSAATTAVQTAASYWNQQANANISLVYGGTTSGTSLTMNNKNEVFFRNDTNGSTIAEAYWWWDGSGNLVDADIVFHEGAYQFFAVSGCTTSGYYIEDIGVHEFGHVLGLGHSATVGATMYPYVPTTCDTTQESLDADDLSGIQALYPPNAAPNAPTSLSAAPATSAPSSSISMAWSDNATNETGYLVQRSSDGVNFTQVAQLGANVQSYTNTGLSPSTTYFYRVQAINGTAVSGYSNTASAQTSASTTTNSAPTVAISTPSNNASYPANTTVSFSGSASDTTDGNLSSSLVWTSSLDGQIGTGASFSRPLSAGTHTITARATDSGGLSGSAQITVSVTTTQSQSGPSLTARGYKVKGGQKVDLSWTGFTTTSVDIYRNSTRITTATGTTFTDSLSAKGGGTYSYKACAAGSATTCSNTASVTF